MAQKQNNHKSMPYSINSIPYEIQEKIIKFCYWDDPQSLIELCKAYTVLRQVAIGYLQSLEKLGRTSHKFDNWTLWQLENLEEWK